MVVSFSSLGKWSLEMQWKGVHTEKLSRKESIARRTRSILQIPFEKFLIEPNFQFIRNLATYCNRKFLNKLSVQKKDLEAPVFEVNNPQIFSCMPFI